MPTFNHPFSHTENWVMQVDGQTVGLNSRRSPFSRWVGSSSCGRGVVRLTNLILSLYNGCLQGVSLPSFLSSLQVAGQQVYNSLSDRNASMALGGAGKGEGTFGAIKLPTTVVL